MNIAEFSNKFDVLINSFGDYQTSLIRLDEYEKSVLLTQALEEYIIQYFTSANPTGMGIDDSIKRQLDFSSLIKTDSRTFTKLDKEGCFDDRGVPITWNKDILFPLNEKLICSEDGSVTGTPIARKIFMVIPIHHSEYSRIMSLAYTLPLSKQAWRMFKEGDPTSCELIPMAGYTPIQYVIRYIKRPSPIILTDLEDDLNIQGEVKALGCILNPIVHNDILVRAVELAFARVGSGAKNSNDNNKSE